MTTNKPGRQVETLTAKQAAFVENLLEHGEIDRAAEEAGYLSTDRGRQVAASKSVVAAIRAGVENTLQTEGISKAKRTMIDLLDAKFSGAVRLGAAKWLLEADGFGAKAARDDDKPLAEMTEAELVAFIAKLDAAQAKGAKPPTIRVIDAVTPDIRA